MNKVLISVLLLGVLIAIPIVNANSGSVDFQVLITNDTTISIPTLCETGTPNGYLEFNLGLEGIAAATARPFDSCASGSIGDFNITNDGNVLIDLEFSLNQSAPLGVEIAVGDQEAYDVANYFVLDTLPTTLAWSNDIDPITSDVVQVWQRIGANASAMGGSVYLNAIEISSVPYWTP